MKMKAATTCALQISDIYQFQFCQKLMKPIRVGEAFTLRGNGRNMRSNDKQDFIYYYFIPSGEDKDILMSPPLAASVRSHFYSSLMQLARCVLNI